MTTCQSNQRSRNIFSAFSCYPIASQIATYVDQDTLKNFASTCWHARMSILQYRDALMKQTLRCHHDCGDQLPQPQLKFCVRSVVGICVACSSLVCQACNPNRVTPELLDGRHRKLCLTCQAAPLKEVVGKCRMEPIVPSKLCQCSESSIICAVSVLEAWNDRYLRKLRLWSDPLRNAAVEPSRLGCAKERKCCGFKPTINPGEWEPVEATAEPVTNKFLTVTWNEYNRAQISETIEEFEGAMRRRLITKTWTWNAVAPWNEELMNMSDDETSGERRSYCGWCDKIIPSKADVEAQKAIR